MAERSVPVYIVLRRSGAPKTTVVAISHVLPRGPVRYRTDHPSEVKHAAWDVEQLYKNLLLKCIIGKYELTLNLKLSVSN